MLVINAVFLSTFVLSISCSTMLYCVVTFPIIVSDVLMSYFVS